MNSLLLRQFVRPFMILTLIGVLATGCGTNDDETDLLKPHPIPQQYKGQSIELLKTRSGDFSYDDLIIGGGDWRSRPDVAEHLDKAVGRLVWFQGRIDRVFVSVETTNYQIWLCAKEVEIGGNRCGNPVFLLYSSERGPEIIEGDTVQVAGLVVGSYKRSVKIANPGYMRILTPMVSVIKAETVSYMY